MKKDNKKGFWKTIWNFTSSYKKNLITAMVFSMLTGIAIAFQPIIIKHIICLLYTSDAADEL